MIDLMIKTDKVINLFFIDHLMRFSDNTTASYKIALKQFFNFCQKEFDQVEENDAINWQCELMNKNLKPRSINLKFSAINSFFEYCKDEGFLKQNPFKNIRAIKVQHPPPNSLDKCMLIQLKEAASCNQRDRALVETLFATGLRVSELINIELAHIDWDMRLILVQNTKNNDERKVPFSTECAERIRQYLAARKIESPYLFPNEQGKPLSRIFVYKIITKHVQDLSFHATPHTLRHTLGRHLAAKGMDIRLIQIILGHRSINNTKIYTKLDEKTRKKYYDQYQ